MFRTNTIICTFVFAKFDNITVCFCFLKTEFSSSFGSFYDKDKKCSIYNICMYCMYILEML